jgi:hypothetical protein
MFRAIGFAFCGVEFKGNHGVEIIPLLASIRSNPPAPNYQNQ